MALNYAAVEDLGNPDEQAFVNADQTYESYEDDTGDDADVFILDPEDAKFIHELVTRTLLFCETLADIELRPYQRDLGYRIIESLILADGEEITALWARQSGKSETVSVVIAGIVVLFPKLAESFAIMERFKKGVWIGVFGPTDQLSQWVYKKVAGHLTSDYAQQVLEDPEIDEQVKSGSSEIRLKSGSFIRRQTANPRAKVEGATYHIVLIDEAQDADDTVVRKSINPMLATTAGTKVKIGTPSFHKGDFFQSIQFNKRRATQRGQKRNHFEFDWKTVAKYNPFYERHIKQEKLRIGEDSDEFLMCVAPETRVLTADLRHIPAEDVRVGMELVGFDEHVPAPHSHRKFRTAVVEAVSTVLLPSYRITLSDGTTVVASEDHLWLVRTSGSRTTWVRTSELASQRYASKGSTPRIIRATDVWDEAPHTFVKGYLAAAFDGEGHLSSPAPGSVMCGFSQKENPMLQQVRKYLGDYGFASSERVQPTDVTTLLLLGGTSRVAEFLGTIRPQRLLNKFRPEMLGSLTRRGTQLEHPQVVGVEFLGDTEVVAFRTSTRTFVAEGLASHNSYSLKWMLDRGMLITSEDLDFLADPSMQVVKAWQRTPVVVGIDPARTKDSTVVTVCWVDWDHPDPAGYREHRILNWLEINNADWESQYFQILEFLEPYKIAYIGVDAQGMGSAVAERLERLMGHRCEVHGITSDLKNQSERWKHLIQLLQRNMVIYPGHSKARRLRVWKRFRQQMEDAEKVFKNQYLLVQAPDDTRNAHDDYVDSLALACAMSMNDTVEEVQAIEAPWFRHR